MTAKDNPPGSPGSRWWEPPGLLRVRLLRLDSQVGAVVNGEKHVIDPAVFSGEVAGQLRRIAQQLGVGAGDGAVEQSDRAPGFESVKPGFTREAGLVRRQVSDR